MSVFSCTHQCKQLKEKHRWPLRDCEGVFPIHCRATVISKFFKTSRFGHEMAASKTCQSGRQTVQWKFSFLGSEWRQGKPPEQHRKEQHLSAVSFTALNVHFVQNTTAMQEGRVFKEASHLRHSKSVLPSKSLNILENEELQWKQNLQIWNYFSILFYSPLLFKITGRKSQINIIGPFLKWSVFCRLIVHMTTWCSQEQGTQRGIQQKLSSRPSCQDWLKKLHRTSCIRKFSFLWTASVWSDVVSISSPLWITKSISDSSDSSSEPGILKKCLVRALCVYWPWKSLNFKLLLHKVFPACLCFGLLQSAETAYALKPVCFFSPNMVF